MSFIFKRIEIILSQKFRWEKNSDKLIAEIISAGLFSCRNLFRRNSQKLSEFFSAEVFPPNFFLPKFLGNNVCFFFIVFRPECVLKCLRADSFGPSNDQLISANFYLWLKKILKFDLKRSSLSQFYHFWHSYFTIVEENFKISPFETFQIHSILPASDIPYFTMVEENFKFPPKTLQIDSILLPSDTFLTSSWLKKILNFHPLKHSRSTRFYHSLRFKIAPGLNKLTYTLFYENSFYKNHDAQICKILRIF